MSMDTTKVKQKGRSFLSKIVFSHTMITIILLLIQLMVIFSMFRWFSSYIEYFLGIFTLLSIILVVYIVNCNSKPEFKLAWMIPVCVVPVFGVMLYLFIETNLGALGLKQQLGRCMAETRPYLYTKKEVKKGLEEKRDGIADLVHYLEYTAGFPVYDNTQITYFPSGEDKFHEMKQELEKAKEFIFLEYFIVERGVMWNEILEILERKVKEGVEVRVMYDGMCSILLLPYSYPKKLRKMGLKAKMYAPIKPMLSTHQNNRDHRKILVIDGKVGFCGGINLADEYINEKELFGHWKDVAVLLRGDAVKSLTAMFLQVWNIGEKAKEDYAKYLNIQTDRIPMPGDGLVIPYGDDATNEEDLAENVYLDVLNKAQDYVYIMTPYLIIDNEMLSALTFAAKRGVEVAIIMPHIPDKYIPSVIAKTYYNTLINAGVKIYEYTPGFVHAKTFLSDDCKGIVGTINLDYRSLYHHFECAVYIYKNSVIEDMKRDFIQTVAKCHLVTLRDCKKRKAFDKLAGRVFRIIGPLM